MASNKILSISLMTSTNKRKTHASLKHFLKIENSRDRTVRANG